MIGRPLNLREKKPPYHIWLYPAFGRRAVSDDKTTPNMGGEEAALSRFAMPLKKLKKM